MATQDLARNAFSNKRLATPDISDKMSHDEAYVLRGVRPCPSQHLNVDQYNRLLEFIERESGLATIDAISCALPDVIQPISAVMDLCDAGILNVDWECAFGGDMHVWRVDC